tara:strand:+ start:96 stop:614 length:519 start_codon:yes stop_codon:yes gene_type:complete
MAEALLDIDFQAGISQPSSHGPSALSLFVTAVLCAAYVTSVILVAPVLATSGALLLAAALLSAVAPGAVLRQWNFPNDISARRILWAWCIHASSFAVILILVDIYARRGDNMKQAAASVLIASSAASSIWDLYVYMTNDRPSGHRFALYPAILNTVVFGTTTGCLAAGKCSL